MLLILLALAGVVVGVGVWLADRHVRKKHGVAVRVLVGLLSATLGLLLVAILFWGLVLLALEQPWPVSLRHGPDTGYAQEQFSRNVDRRGVQVATQVYAWRQWAGPGEHVLFVCFRPLSADVIPGVVAARQLSPVPAAQRPMLPGWTHGPQWWLDGESQRLASPVYRGQQENRQAFTRFWPALPDGRACLLEVDIG